MKKIIAFFAFLLLSIGIGAYAQSKPTSLQICKDLIGTRLTEGYEDGWHSDQWHWDIEAGQIKSFKIEDVLISNSTDYCVLVHMLLESDVNAYTAKVKINYRYIHNAWQMEFAVSKGMDIVRTHKYDDCLSFSIADDGWGGVNMLEIKNNSGIELGCAGYIQVRNGEWKKFSVKIAPYKTGGVGGTFGGGSVTNYKIEFIERP